LKLLNTNVGVIVLSAGVGNDVTGWILLALCVALVNAGSGITALWVLLVAVGYVLFLSLLIRPVFMWYLRKTGSLEKGPSQSVVTVTLLLALASAFFTQAIGIHAIFGGFLVGLLCPHEGGFAIKLTEKIEDLVAAIFLPLYFALSGLQTNLGLLDSGVVWGYVVAIIAIAFFAKVAGGTLASKLAGLLWRESVTVGVLMSCKGLVELIVLVRQSSLLFMIFSNNISEHRSSSQNPQRTHFHHVCCHGLDSYFPHNAAHLSSVPEVVSGQGCPMETWGN
jgi:Kef-type K+ transport system membrane component KefB